MAVGPAGCLRKEEIVCVRMSKGATSK
jgi:hypothetical protein